MAIHCWLRSSSRVGSDCGGLFGPGESRPRDCKAGQDEGSSQTFFKIDEGSSSGVKWVNASWWSDARSSTHAEDLPSAFISMFPLCTVCRESTFAHVVALLRRPDRTSFEVKKKMPLVKNLFCLQSGTYDPGCVCVWEGAWDWGRYQQTLSGSFSAVSKPISESKYEYSISRIF